MFVVCCFKVFVVSKLSDDQNKQDNDTNLISSWETIIEVITVAVPIAVVYRNQQLLISWSLIYAYHTTGRAMTHR